MKVVFLDIDGVLTSCRIGFFNFDIYAINFLTWFFDKVGFKIVISSTWRNSHGKEFWETIFPNMIHDDWRTKRYGGEMRGFEVREWLKRHPEVTDYLIIDDDKDFFEDQIYNCLFTNPEDGFLFIHIIMLSEKYGLNAGSFDDMKEIYIHPNMMAVNGHIAKRVIAERILEAQS